MPSCYKKRGGVRGGATHIHKRKLSLEPHVKKGYKLGTGKPSLLQPWCSGGKPCVLSSVPI